MSMTDAPKAKYAPIPNDVLPGDPGKRGNFAPEEESFDVLPGDPGKQGNFGAPEESFDVLPGDPGKQGNFGVPG
jgi:hypothetical protein